ncbi:hypothetical protein M407DRAFT_31578 [Tulasnella calospora MUT 4182]|uniref:Uncharacterized protein n=1 Tax=Tulasnella calospora MUT 4182 TaxID=1051891 RepID=A0A0C3Q673_9AGAM|nr:hypothetical protein M407DRAFT_31578 [Tulasnella calospora MUT 4182]
MAVASIHVVFSTLQSHCIDCVTNLNTVRSYNVSILELFKRLYPVVFQLVTVDSNVLAYVVDPLQARHPASPPPYAAANVGDRSANLPVLASRLCTLVPDHVLYLNGQIPLGSPVQGISSLELDGKANAEAAKKPDELVATLDLLSSCLRTPFQSLSWALATDLKLLKAIYSSSTTQVDVVLVTGRTPTTLRIRNAPPVQVPNSSAQASTSSPTAPPNINPVVPPNAVAPTFVSDMSRALSSPAEEEDEGTGPDENVDEEEGDAENGDASPSLASEDEGGEEEESEVDFDKEESDEERSAVLEEDEKNLRASVRTVSLALASTFDFGRDDIPIAQMKRSATRTSAFSNVHPGYRNKLSAVP